MTNQDKMREQFEAWASKWSYGVLNSDDDAGRVSRLGAWAAWQAATAAAARSEGWLPPEEVERLRVERDALLEAATRAVYMLERARIWGGTEWHYNPIQPPNYLKARDALKAAIDAAMEKV